MRIGIDATFLSFPLLRGGGIGRYIRGLLPALAVSDRANQYAVFAGQDGFSYPATWDVHRSSLPLNYPALRVLWHHFLLPRHAARAGLDWLFSPSYTIPSGLGERIQAAVAVHDLFFLRFPHMYRGRFRLAYLKRSLARSLERARLVLCPSEATKADLLSFLDVPAEKIHVIPYGYSPLGVDEALLEGRSSSILRSLEVRYGLDKEFVLFVGTLEPRKNVPTLIRAFSLLRRMGHPHLQLVIVGRGRFHAQKRGPEELDLGNVIFTGYLNDEELWVVYRASKIFAMLSIWEGFGFPFLEAMAADVPVIASNTASIPEVVGDGGLLVDPSDSEAIALAMRRLLEDEPLRRELIAKGRRQVARFQWSATARRTASALISADGRR